MLDYVPRGAVVLANEGYRGVGARPKSKRKTPTTIPTATSKPQIDHTANSTPANTSLTIPNTILFDNAHPSARDIVFSNVQLSEMTNHIFQQT